MSTFEPVALPDMGAPIADTHAHLDMLDDPAGALARAAAAGVSLVLTVTDVTEAPEATFDGLHAWLAESERILSGIAGAKVASPDVRIVAGCHPHNAADFDATAGELLEHLAGDARVAAIGEAGLDFHYDHSPRDDQRGVFRAQIEVAHRHGLPLVVHLRDAHEEGLDTLTEQGVPEAGCVIHCFTGDARLASGFVELGCHISFAGPTTFKKADTIREAAASVPLERILVETDCPFLAPVPYRGKTNEPAWATLTAAVLAEAKGVDTAEFATVTTASARKLFCGRRGEVSE